PGLVQVRALSLARGDRSARRDRRVRDDAFGRHRGPGLGFPGRGPLSVPAAAAGGDRRPRRGRARRPGHPRWHDRDGAAVNGVHDLGGMENLGPVAPEPDEPVFHTDWEAVVHALVVPSPTRGNIDEGRHQRELIPGPAYLAMSYY